MRTPLHPSTTPKREQKRDRHGFRGTPPPASFSLRDLPDDALLTEHEVASVGRWSTNTLASWRRQPSHPLTWELVAGKYVRYRAGALKRYMAATPTRKLAAPPSHVSAEPRSRGPPEVSQQ
jgi:hypothetical protein